MCFLCVLVFARCNTLHICCVCFAALYCAALYVFTCAHIHCDSQDIHPYESEFVYVDPHILCTPNIADIDGDGHEEIVVVVSYFFDRE